MTTRYGASALRGAWLAAILGIVSIGWLAARPAAAADSPAKKAPPKTQTSLDWIPEDAAFYFASLGNREKVEAIAKSRAWDKLRKMPAVQMALQMVEMQSANAESPAGKAKATLDDPQVQDLLALAADMASTEMFFYGDADMAGFLGLMQQIRNTMNYGPAMVAMADPEKAQNPRDVQAMLLLGVLADNLDAVKLPGFVLGFKLTDTSRAVLNLGKLEMIAGIAVKQNPLLADSLKRTKIAGHEFLVLTLKGEMVPWDKVPLDKLRELEAEEGSVDKLVAKLKKESLVIAIGLRDDYLLMAIGSSTDVVAKLGQGKCLADRPEWAPLAPYAKNRLASIAYASKAMAQAADGSRGNLDDLLEFGNQVLPQAGLDEKQEAKIRKDAAALADDIKRILPEPGAIMSVGFLTDQGVESYTYNWGSHPQVDASKPLGLLSHVGGTPILAVVSRGKVSVESYDLFAKWVGVGYGYFKEYGLPRMQESEREKFNQYAGKILPLVEQSHKATRDLLLPALDGQCGLVVDARLTSKQFLATLPATEKPMPMAEPAIVLGVKDAGLMRQALTEYWTVIQGAAGVAAKNAPEANVTIPEPATVAGENGEMFVFTPPDTCPVDKQIAPTVGLGKDVCVFSASKAHAERLLKTTPLAAGGLLTKTDRPLAMAAYFDWAGLLAAGTPWIDMAADRIIADKMPPDAAKTQGPAIKEQVHTVLEVLSVLRHITSETYAKDGAMVTHTLVEIRDVK